MNVKEIITTYLKANRFDGLYTDGCLCTVDNIAPCDGYDIQDCLPGVKVPCDPETCIDDGNCDYHIGRRKYLNVYCYRCDSEKDIGINSSGKHVCKECWGSWDDEEYDDEEV